MKSTIKREDINRLLQKRLGVKVVKDSDIDEFRIALASLEASAEEFEQLDGIVISICFVILNHLR